MSNLLKFQNDLIIDGCDLQFGNLYTVYSVLEKDKFPTEIIKKHENEDLYFLGGVKIGTKGRAKDDHITHKNSFFLDFDIREWHKKQYGKEISKEEIKNSAAGYIVDKLDSHTELRNWRYLVFTANGIHIHFIGDTVEVEDKLWWRLGVEHFIEEAVRTVGIEIDPACKNAARLSRFPGTYNNKNGQHTLVEILYYQDRTFKIHEIQDVGKALAIFSDEEPENSIEPSDPDNTLSVINSIPIGGIVASLTGWRLEKNHFYSGGDTKPKACFVADKGNFLVHGGTDHLPPDSEGYSPFSFVKTWLKLDSKDTFAWFRKNYQQVREASKREYEEKKKNSFPFVTLDTMVDKSAKYIDELDPNSIFSYGYAPLDDHLGGIYPSEVVLVGGESGLGKSSFITSILRHNSLRHKVVLFSLEDTLLDYTLKQLWFSIGKIRKRAGHKNYPWKEFRNNNIVSSSYAEEREEAERMTKDSGNLIFYDRGHEDAPKKMDVDTLEDLIIKSAERGYKLFGIDHLHFFNIGVQNRTKADAIEEVMQRIKGLADKLEVAILLVAHYHKLRGEKPTLDSFKDSSSIVQTANVVINMWRDRSDDLGTDINETHFMMPKIRSPVGEKTIVMKFNPYTFEYEYVDQKIGTKQELTREKEISLLKAPKKQKKKEEKPDDLPF